MSRFEKGKKVTMDTMGRHDINRERKRKKERILKSKKIAPKSGRRIFRKSTKQEGEVGK